MIRRVSSTALVIVALVVLAPAQKTISVGIPTAQFNFVSAAQLQNEWCWAAAVQMVLNWYHLPITQSEVVERIYGRPVDAAVSEDVITQALSGVGRDRAGNLLQVRALRKQGIPPGGLLVGEMERERPMLVTIHSSQSMLHAMVITSAEYKRTKNGVFISALIVRDPNPVFKNRRPALALRLTGANLGRFVRSISSYYLVSVKE